MGWLTFTCSVPSGTSSFPILPSSTASTSMVALSVSISAITSPARTASPSPTYHLTSFPSSIVGDSAGMRIWVGIGACRSGIDVGKELGWVGLGVSLRELGRLVHHLADRAVDFLELFVGRVGTLEQPLAHELDRIAMLSHVLHLLARPVLSGVRHGMAAIAIGAHLEDHGSIARADRCKRPLAGVLDRRDVHAVDPLTLNAEGDPAIIELLGESAGALDRGAHRVMIVLDDIEYGELPQRRHVEALIDLALISRPFAEERDAHGRAAAIFVGEGDAGAERSRRADDAVAAEEVLLHREHVHRAALALGIAVAAPGELGHHALGVHA